jgi:hypothetical protein
MSTSAGLVGGVGVGQSGRAVVVAIRDAGVGGPSTDAVKGADNAGFRGAVLGGTVGAGASAASVNFLVGDGVGQSGCAFAVAGRGAGVGGPNTFAGFGADNAGFRGAVLGGTVGAGARRASATGLVGDGVGQSGRAVVVAIRDAGVGGPRTDAGFGADNAGFRGAGLGFTVCNDDAGVRVAVRASAGLEGGNCVGKSGRAVAVAYRDAGVWGTKNRRSRRGRQCPFAWCRVWCPRQLGGNDRQRRLGQW